MNGFAAKKLIVGCCLSAICVVGAWAQGVDTASGGRNSEAADQKNRARIHTELGAMYFQAGNPKAALDELGVALGVDPGYVQAYSVRGLVYGQLKEADKAEGDFHRALNLAPNDPEVNNNYGWYLCESGKERQSVPYFLQALKDPLYTTPDRAYSNAGTCSLRAGDLDGAQRYLLTAISLSHDGASIARLQLAKLLYMRGNNEEARVYLSDALKQIEPPTPEALWLGVRIERKLGNRADESAYAAQLRSRYPASAEYQEFLKGNFQ